MRYLYGDSTPSALEVNFIEFVRDAVDFCVQVLLADQRVAHGRAHTRSAEQTAVSELERLQKLPPLVTKAFDGLPTGDPDSATARCVAAISRSAADLVRAEAIALRSSLDIEMSKRDAQAAQEREACLKALETLLLKHDLPDTTQDVDVALAGGSRYVCRARVKTGSGLEAILDLEIAADDLFEGVVRVDSLSERLDVHAPEIGGWLHKEVKQKTQHLDKHHVAEFLMSAGGGTLKLRAAADGTGPGFDVLFSKQAPRVRMVRAADKRQDESEPPFEVDEADAQKLLAVYDKLAAAVNALAAHRRKLLDAKLDGEPMLTHPKPTLLVERLIASIAPVVQEIAARSQSPGELVLRRLLSGDRREEIFLSKSELKVKLEPLEAGNRALFDSLWESVPPAAPAKAAAPAPSPTRAPTVEPPEPPRPQSVPSRPAPPASGVQPTPAVASAAQPANGLPLSDVFRRTLLGTAAQVEAPAVNPAPKPPPAEPARVEAAGVIDVKRAKTADS